MPVFQSTHFEIVTTYEQAPNPGVNYSVSVRAQSGMMRTHLSLRNETMRELRDALNKVLTAEGAAVSGETT